MFGQGFTVFNEGLLTGAAMAPDEGGWLKTFILILYVIVMTVLWVFGLHRYVVMWYFARTKTEVPEPVRVYSDDELPMVTVQLAVFNEMYVVERLLDAVCAMDYPRDRFEVQVLDDSTDETVAISRARVALWKERGVDIVHVHRVDRTGYKAGALANGLKTCRGEFIAMFDADFVPPVDFLRRQIHFFSDPKIGFVQARWGHINEDQSLLTKLQALLLDGHFVLEHTGRHRSKRFFNFSGTAGMWRKATIADAGGWQHDTLVEDFDLSYRAQLKGWRGTYLVDQVVPAELPPDMNAFKNQQFRWCKGTTQVMKKLLWKVLRSDEPMRVKIEAVFHMTGNLSYPLMVFLAVLMLPALFYRVHLLSAPWSYVFDISLFLGATASVGSFIAYARRQIDPRWRLRLPHVPLVMAIGLGIMLSQTKGVIEALRNQQSPFVRTPKYKVESGERDQSWRLKRYSRSKSVLPLLELFFAAYFIGVVCYAAWQGLWLALPFMGMFAWGFSYVGLLSAQQSFQWRFGRRPAPANAPTAS